MVRQGRLVITDDPSCIRPNVAMRGPRRINNVICQQQPSPLLVMLGIKNNVPTLTVIAGSGKLGCNLDWPAKLLRSAGNVHRMEPLVIIATRVLTHRDYINCSMWAGCKIDYGSRSNSNFRRNLGAAPVVRCGRQRRERGQLP